MLEIVQKNYNNISVSQMHNRICLKVFKMDGNTYDSFTASTKTY